MFNVTNTVGTNKIDIPDTRPYNLCFYLLNDCASYKNNIL